MTSLHVWKKTRTFRDRNKDVLSTLWTLYCEQFNITFYVVCRNICDVTFQLWTVGLWHWHPDNVNLVLCGRFRHSDLCMRLLFWSLTWPLNFLISDLFRLWLFPSVTFTPVLPLNSLVSLQYRCFLPWPLWYDSLTPSNLCMKLPLRHDLCTLCSMTSLDCDCFLLWREPWHLHPVTPLTFVCPDLWYVTFELVVFDDSFLSWPLRCDLNLCTHWPLYMWTG